MRNKDFLSTKHVEVFIFYCLFLLMAGPSKAQVSLPPPSKVFNMMAPLLLSPGDWALFRAQLRDYKRIGVTAISTDVWWGIVEPADQQFNWTYYDQISDAIIEAGLKWMPILSTHRCGGNIGDTCNIPLPNWIWFKYVGRNPKIKNGDSLKYYSEQEHFSSEVISVWGTEVVLPDYYELYLAFKKHFQSKLSHISEVNISLGPAGELRYPSYNSHDVNSDYPNRGTVQAYSEIAVQSFRQAVIYRYRTLEAVNQAWGISLQSWNEVYPPERNFLRSDEFFRQGHHFSRYGKDFYDWYHYSLLRHGQLLMGLAARVFRAGLERELAPELGAKVPGIHWRMGSDRLAELNAGLIQTSDALAFYSSNGGPAGLGYNNLFSLFSKQRYVFHFTCLEMGNYENQNRSSLAETLVFLVSRDSGRYGIMLKGENALAGNLNTDRGWDKVENVMAHSNYQGLTFLRMGEFNAYAFQRLERLIRLYSR